MRGILAVLLLLATVEGNPFWNGAFQPPGHSFLPPGHSFQPPGPPFPFPGLGLGRHGQQNGFPRPQQPGLDLSNAEWVCTNPKTHDMIVITAVKGSQTVINGQTLPCGGCPDQSGCSNGNTNPSNTNCKEQEPNTGTTADETTRIDTGEGIIESRMNIK